MAVSIVLTGTGQNCTLTSGSNTITVSNTTSLIVGATIQGTGIPTGSRIGAISGTTVTMVTATGAASNATVSGTQSLIFSSVYGSTLTISMSGATDYATPQAIYDAGFGVMSDNIAKKEIFFAGRLTVKWANIVAGAVFDFGNWTMEWGDGGRWLFQESSILGELRGGYLVNGTQFIKAAGPTFYANFWNNGGAGGSSMFENVSGTTNQGLFRMHNPRFVEVAGSNAGFVFSSARMTMTVENMILDYQTDSAGANAGIGAAFGTLKNTYLVKTNAGIIQTNGSNYATFDGIQYVGNYQSVPQHKFSLPNGYTLDGYSPQVLSTQFLGGFNSATSEIYSNINLSTAGWGLEDLKTKYQRYGGPITLQFPRTVSFQFNDANAADLTGVTLFIKSGTTSLVNAVQSGDYSAATQALNLVWTTNVSSYRTCNSFVDTIAQTAQVRKNGYISQSVSYSLNTAAYSQPVFMLTDPAYGSVTPAQAAALTGLALDYTNKVYTVSTAHNLDEVYAFGQYSQALTANSTQADFQTSTGGKYALTSPWKMSVTGGALTMGTYNNTFNSSTAWTFGATASLNMDKDDVVWTPAARADLWQFQNGSTFNITNGSTLTVSPTAGLGYGTATTSEFRSGSTLNMSDSTVTYNILASQSGTVFSNTEAGATWNISNSTLTLNCPNGAQVAIHAYFLPTSVINNFTVNGTASNVIWQMGYTSNNSKMVGFKYGGAIFGNGTSNILMDTYTYTGSLTSINNTFGSANKWWWVDPTMQAGGLFRWAAGSTPTGSSGFYGVIGFRPTFTIDKTGYAPKMRVKPSAMATRYPTQIFNTTALSTVARSNFFRDPTFMDSSDGFLPFLDSLDSKTVLNTIDWEVQVRQAGWQDLTQTFTAATAKTGLITAAFAGVVDAYYVNASTGLADSALISVNTSTKTISAVSGSLTWSPQRLYNALKNWWATYASDTDFLSTTSGSTLKLGDYNVASNISFVEGNSNDVLTAISTTGLINAATNEIPVTDSRGTSTIWQFENIAVGSSIVIYDASGVTKYFQQEVTTAGNYIYYIQPGTTGTYTWAIELYGKQRQSGSFAANTGGLLFYEPIYVEDVGITETTKATVAAYTAIETSSKFYDRTAYFRLSEQGIKLGQIVTRAGTSLEIGTFSHLINKDSASVYSITGSVITTKSTSYAGDSKYTTEIATPPATITANTNEVITITREDANGDSQVTISASGNNQFEIWKITDATNPDDYATGTLLDTVGIGAWRFIHADGYKMVIRDTTTNFRVVVEMEKGVYTAELFFGAAVQLAQAAEVTQINTKVDILQNAVDVIETKTSGLTYTIPNVLDANIQYVNDIEVKGTGEDNDPWNPV
jgi:hypothetical protein